MRLWSSIGGTQMIIFLAGLQGIPETLYDAASIDGATAWQRIRHVTIPLLTPTIFFQYGLGHHWGATNVCCGLCGNRRWAGFCHMVL
ncbi:ABC transporter permease subunit [Chloroflexi bacterium TSY]|nr:ABC transporter permease subunit [Chloroflexi bacterium TSY]